MSARRAALRPSWLLAATGLTGLAVAVGLRPSEAASAAAQDWSPFVLVAGLLMIGLVADGDGLFAAAGARLATAARNGGLLFTGAALLITVVTATLNLDTSVAFLTPVLVHTARSRGEGEPALLYGCLLLSNAGSLLLPGSNLTNLIVLGHLHLNGGQFAARMWLPWIGAVVATAAVVAIGERRSLHTVTAEPEPAPRPVLGLGLAAIIAATVIVIVIRSSALPVFVIGAVVAGIRAWQGRSARNACGRCSAFPCWPACSAPRLRWARWAAPGRGRRCCSRTCPGGRLRRSRRWQPWWSTTFRPPACWPRGRRRTRLSC